MGQTIDNLRGEFERRRHMSTDGKHFISQHEVNALLTRTVIEEVITECVREYAVPDHQEKIVANRIFTEEKIVFGILIWKKWLHKLMSFIQHNALDSQLPLEITWAEKIAETVGWDFAKNAQWEFLPQTLKKEMSGYHCRFRAEEILPFINETPLGEGSFGQVFKMSVVPSLQTIFPEHMAEVFIVRKRLRNESNTVMANAKREEECLQILDHLRHPNIVPLLASYSHCANHNFLFPLLPMDLEDFLKLRERFGEFQKDFMFYTALHGLSSAIEKVHSLNLNARDHDVELGRIGYHHDLKPSNVLVDSRTFYLADFGLAKLKTEDMGSRTHWKAGLGDYVAPECMDENLRHQDVGRPLDIWSFGCMVSEIAAYIEGGPDGVNSFREQRSGAAFRANMKDRYFFTGKDLRPQVTTWFENFKARCEGSVLHNLLEAAGVMLQIDPIKRPKAAKVHQQLLFLSLKALFNAAQQALTRYLGVAEDNGDIGPTVSVIRFQKARLASWGKVLHFTGSGPSAIMEIINDKGDHFRHILTSLLGRVERDIKGGLDEAMPPSAVAFSIRKPFHEELQELIQILCQDEALRDIVTNTQSGHYSELGALASTKLDILRLRRDKNQDHEIQIDNGESLLLSSDALHIENEFGDGLSIGRYYNKQVFVEWVSPTAKWNKLSDPQKEQRMLFTTKIFRLPSKPSGFRVLDCLGFVVPTAATSKQHDYAYIWAFPESTLGPLRKLKRIAPICLFNIIKSRNKVGLPLGERFQLAYKLVSCVRELNIVRWLHKNISSSNIVFFEQEGSASELSDVLENPYLVNFRYSRPSDKAGQTEKTLIPASNSILQHYRHPGYSSSQSFRELYDYYSIGIVLLELGSWTTLDVYLEHNPGLESDPAAFSQKLIDHYTPRLSHIMGARYRNITLACLRGDFGNGSGGGGGEEQTVLEQFHDKVVEPLGELSRWQI
ncbi:kinase-like domain-containing protein [Trichophaea hybrida]|nr:kinase-like domain-containing protein [Trichophaea hybrida]